MQSPIKYLQFNLITEKTKHYQTAERIFWKLMLTSKLNTLLPSSFVCDFLPNWRIFCCYVTISGENMQILHIPECHRAVRNLYRATSTVTRDIHFDGFSKRFAIQLPLPVFMTSKCLGGNSNTQTSACYANYMYLTDCTTAEAPLPWSLILSVTVLHVMQAWNMSSTILRFQRSNDTLKIYIETCAHKFCAFDIVKHQHISYNIECCQ